MPAFADLVAFDSVAGTGPWVDRLAGDGVDRLWLAVTDPGPTARAGGLTAPVSAAFVGGVPVGLLGTGRAGNLLWQAQWSVGSRVADGARIVVANYVSQPVPTGPARVGVAEAVRELDEALSRAVEFADRQQLPTWARVFAAARQRPARNGGLFPPSWPDADGPRLADTALAAWVFGGMGSWNDLGFADGGAQREYERISTELFDAVMRACVAAVNIDLR